jgi:hypothetical protein
MANKIRQSNLDTSIFTGHTELTVAPADDDILIVYDTSTGTIKKVNRNKVIGAPSLSSVSPTNILSGDGTGNATFTLTGADFDGSATAVLLTSGGSEVSFDSVTRDSATQITGVIAISSLSNANEPYGVKVTNGNSTTSTLTGQINIDAQPAFITSSGSLGNFRISGSFEVDANDPDSAGSVTYELQSGSLPPGFSITNSAADGGKAIISGTTPSVASSDTTYNFVIRAVDVASNTSSRAFSITSQGPVTASFTSSGTFSVPDGVTALPEVLVVAGGGGGGSGGGGGGAGGLIYFPCYPVTPNGTITVTVGCGGFGQSGFDYEHSPSATYARAQNSAFGSPGDPGLGLGGVLTAIGGGGGGTSGPSPSGTNPCGQNCSGRPGGSGGGTGRDSGAAGSAGQGIQPTQPGNSGAYGFGNPGGVTPGVSWAAAAGGGGAGASGGNGDSGGPPPDNSAGPGGVGKAYTIADGTTPVYYAGGGGGRGVLPAGADPSTAGGQGGGGRGKNDETGQPSTAGQANKGGGAGGGDNLQGGKGIVMVRY